jgi:hypothetical protein
MYFFAGLGKAIAMAPRRGAKKYVKKVAIFLGTFLKSAAQKVAIILSTFTGEAMKSANDTAACLEIF